MTKQQAKAAFGKMVESSKKFEKRFISGHDSRQWVPIEKPVKGVLIGVRTYFNGNTDYGEGCHFTIIDHFQVALIAPGWRNKPVPVPLKDCRLIEGDTDECENCVHDTGNEGRDKPCISCTPDEGENKFEAKGKVEK